MKSCTEKQIVFLKKNIIKVISICGTIRQVNNNRNRQGGTGRQRSYDLFVTPKDKRKYENVSQMRKGFGRGTWGHRDRQMAIDRQHIYEEVDERAQPKDEKECDREGVEESVENLTNNENRNEGDKECGEEAQ